MAIIVVMEQEEENEGKENEKSAENITEWVWWLMLESPGSLGAISFFF